MLSIIITSYNRSQFLIKTVNAIRENLLKTDYELIISDDNSDKETSEAIKKLEPDVFISSSRREGLGSNLNKGCAVACEEHHLILQDDFVCRYNIDSFIATATALLNNNSCDIFKLSTPLDSWRFFPQMRGKPTDYFKGVNHRTENEIRFVTAKNPNVWVYNDNPHIRRSDFRGKFGVYLESVRMSECEIAMKNKFNELGGIAAWSLYFENNNYVFDHIGSELSNREHRGL